MAADAFVRAGSAGAQEIAGTVRISASEVIAVEVLPPILAVAAPRASGAGDRTVPQQSQRGHAAARGRYRDPHGPPDPERAGRTAHRRGAAGVARAGRLSRGAWYAADVRRAAEQSASSASSTTIPRCAPSRPATAIGREDFIFRSDSDLAQLAAIRAGIGIGICQIPLAARDPALVRVMPDALRPGPRYLGGDARGHARRGADQGDRFDHLAEGA